jgi:hypothetical protein
MEPQIVIDWDKIDDRELITIGWRYLSHYHKCYIDKWWPRIFKNNFDCYNNLYEYGDIEILVSCCHAKIDDWIGTYFENRMTFKDGVIVDYLTKTIITNESYPYAEEGDIVVGTWWYRLEILHNNKIPIYKWAKYAFGGNMPEIGHAQDDSKIDQKILISYYPMLASKKLYLKWVETLEDDTQIFHLTVTDYLEEHVFSKMEENEDECV